VGLKFALNIDDGLEPKKATEGSAAYDLFIQKRVQIKPEQRVLINSYVIHECPIGVAGILCPRSGLAMKHGLRLHFSPAVIDSDYRGEIKALVENTGEKPIVLRRGERFVQILYVNLHTEPAKVVDIHQIGSTERGAGGFGSTGK
jgi:dUTP pyrophosphatase